MKLLNEFEGKKISFDEVFKTLMKHYFEKFCKVITDYEIIDLPKKTDLLVIEADQPIKEHVKVFSYFKKVNIIEFKSINDTFRMNRDLYKINIYVGGVLLKAKEAEIDNSTFTLVSSKKPVKLLKSYKKNVQKLKNGVYLIEEISLLPVYIIVIEELELDFEKEVKILKEFTTKRDLEFFLTEVAHKAEEGKPEFIELFGFALSMYIEVMDKIVEKEDISMTVIESNMEKLNERYGLKERYISRGKLEGKMEGKLEGKMEDAKKMLEDGLSVEKIIKYTGLPKEKILKLK